MVPGGVSPGADVDSGAVGEADGFPGALTAAPTKIGNLRFWKRVFGRAGDHFASRFESRTVTRAIPGFLGRIPVHDAAHVSADGRYLVNFTILISIGGDFLAPGFYDHSRLPSPRAPPEKILSSRNRSNKELCPFTDHFARQARS